MIHATKKALTDAGDKVPADEKEKIEAALKDLEDVVTGDDKAEIEAKTQALGEASQKLAEHVQQQAGPDAAAGQAGSEEWPKQEDNVVDAEFEEVKEDDKK